MENIKLSYDDICIVPEEITTIDSRSQCNCYDENGMLPIFASCMDTVVNNHNYETFIENKINVVIPRTVPINDRLLFLQKTSERDGIFIAFSLKEAYDNFVGAKQEIPNAISFKICIDMANGHMSKLLEISKQIKDLYGDRIIIMTGNIANPKTYIDYEKAGIDYVRVGIGGGAACTTSSNVAIHYPYFSLLKEIFEIKQSIEGRCKIIADGNIRGFRDIQKALIYADYVMIGGIFNKALDSAAKTTYGKSYWNINGYKILRPLKTLLTYGREIDEKKYPIISKKIKNGTLVVWKQFYGMSTKIAQKHINEANNLTPKKLKTSEGNVKYQKVEYTLSEWVENETDYLRSAMSYTNSLTLNDYKNTDWITINQIRYNN